jgi:hypothetical protein
MKTAPPLITLFQGFSMGRSSEGLTTTHTNEQSKDYFFVILSAYKNLSFKAAEILHSAALRSE